MNKKRSSPFNIATDLLAGVCVGFFVGLSLDNFFETKPLWIIILTIIGILASMRNIYKEMRDGS
jgi:F0F1-type ATP synthase assembly protein I